MIKLVMNSLCAVAMFVAMTGVAGANERDSSLPVTNTLYLPAMSWTECAFGLLPESISCVLSNDDRRDQFGNERPDRETSRGPEAAGDSGDKADKGRGDHGKGDHSKGKGKGHDKGKGHGKGKGGRSI